MRGPSLSHRHPRESGGPGRATHWFPWIPAFAGMTTEKAGTFRSDAVRVQSVFGKACFKPARCLRCLSPVSRLCPGMGCGAATAREARTAPQHRREREGHQAATARSAGRVMGCLGSRQSGRRIRRQIWPRCYGRAARSSLKDLEVPRFATIVIVHTIKEPNPLPDFVSRRQIFDF